MGEKQYNNSKATNTTSIMSLTKNSLYALQQQQQQHQQQNILISKTMEVIQLKCTRMLQLQII